MKNLKILKYIEESFLVEFDFEINECTDLFKAGVIDSFGYIRLIQFIQDEFSIQLSNEELLSNVITTLDGLSRLVEMKE